MAQVKITKNPITGSIVAKGKLGVNADGKEVQYGYIRVEEREFDVNSVIGGYKVKSALKSVNYDDAMAAVAAGELKDGQVLPGKIVTIESFTQEPGMKPKTFGKDGNACMLDGKAIYFKTEYNKDPNAESVLIHHNNAPVLASQTKITN